MFLDFSEKEKVRTMKCDSCETDHSRVKMLEISSEFMYQDMKVFIYNCN